MSNLDKEIALINETQDFYENELINKLLIKSTYLKTINFTSPTGTGKTKMMAEVIKKMGSDYFFVITTLSRGQLNLQIEIEMAKFLNNSNYLVYGLNDYTRSTILQKEDIIDQIPKNKKIVWFRDEGHINTNRWQEILSELCFRIVNFSATNKSNSDDDIKCNFNHTMMLRTVVQSSGTPEDALDKLLQVKKQHSKVANYNPCAILRILDDNMIDEIYQACKDRNLKVIDISNDEYKMYELCSDDNEYDVIINKFKITEGIDIRRAHVLYMTNEPKNPSTTIQVIGRCRRNALLYRKDIDILSSKNSKLLKDTRVCYVFYNKKDMHILTDGNGDLVSAFCDKISVNELKEDSIIELDNGYLKNGLLVLESAKKDGGYSSGVFKVKKDRNTKLNILTGENVKLSVYDKKTFRYTDVQEEQYVFHNSLLSKVEIKNNYDRYKKITDIRAIPLKDVTNYWIKTNVNGETVYSNCGLITFEAIANIDWNNISAIRKNTLDKNGCIPFDLLLKQDYDGQFLIELSGNFKYSLESNKFLLTCFYYDDKTGNFGSKKYAPKYSVLNEAQLAKHKINEYVRELVKKFSNKLLLNCKLSIRASRPVSISEFHDLYFVTFKYLKSLTIRNDVILKLDVCAKKVDCVFYDSYDENNYTNYEIIDDDKESKLILKFDVDVKQHGIAQSMILEKDLLNPSQRYFSYRKIINDRLSTIIGLNQMKYVKCGDSYTFIEDRAVRLK